MTIAVHIAVPEIQTDLSANFNYNCFIILAAKYPDNHYIFIFDKPFSPTLIIEKNITPVLAGPQIKNRLLQYYFYNFKIPRLLTKYNVDYFISAEICSLRTTIPQCLIIKDLSFLKKNNGFTKTDARYLKKYTTHFVKRSTKIVVLNPSLKPTLVKLYGTDEHKINNINPGIDAAVKANTYEEAETVRNKFTDGKGYFLFFATPSSAANIITMLKAFSIFKKWQKSGMQLVILFSAKEKNTIKDFTSYKYKADVKILNSISVEMNRELIATAYAAIHLPAMEITETEGPNVLASGVPLITMENDFCKSIYGEAALYTAAAEKVISEKMMLLYKDENVRNEFIKKGKAVVARHTRENAAESLFKILADDAG
ncbi:MAG: glycosyltransferase [Ferruginibacter sp.]